MTKKLHVVIVSSDFPTFLHVHPVLGADGHFTLEQQFPAPGLYYLYADGEPNDGDHQVFRFNVQLSKNASPGASCACADRERGCGALYKLI